MLTNNFNKNQPHNGLIISKFFNIIGVVLKQLETKIATLLILNIFLS